ncbi:unnamed protein product, partial [Nesidiocoris tenuis]
MMVLESPLRLYTAAAAGLFPPHSIFPAAAAAAHRFAAFGGGPFAGGGGFLGGPPPAPAGPPPHVRFRPQDPQHVRRPPRRPTSPLSKGCLGQKYQKFTIQISKFAQNKKTPVFRYIKNIHIFCK